MALTNGLDRPDWMSAVGRGEPIKASAVTFGGIITGMRSEAVAKHLQRTSVNPMTRAAAVPMVKGRTAERRARSIELRRARAADRLC